MLAAATDEEDEREGEPPEVKRARRALRAAQRREEEEARRSAALTAELSALSSRVGKLALTSSTLAAGLEPAAAAAAMREAISAEAGALRAQAVLDEVALARRHDTAVEADGDSAGAEAVAAAAMRAAAERERSEGAAARRRAAEARLAREKATEARRQAATAEYDQQQRQVEVAIIALHKTPHSEFVLRGVFEAHDLKGSGILSASEVRAALGELGLKQGSAENDMNSLSLSGFISLARELKRSQPDPRLPSVGTGAAFGVAIGDSEEGEGSEESGESGESETESEETEESDGESSSEESDEEDEEGKREREGNTARPPPTMLGIGAWAKSAAELRSHYARAGLVALQAQLLAEREAVSNRMALACDEAPGYRGQLGSSTYRPSQLDAFKLCRVLAEELVSEIVEAEILSKPERSEEELSKELRSWKRQHARLRNKLARRKKGASPASLTPDGGTAKDAPAGTAAESTAEAEPGDEPKAEGETSDGAEGQGDEEGKGGAASEEGSEEETASEGDEEGGEEESGDERAEREPVDLDASAAATELLDQTDSMEETEDGESGDEDSESDADSTRYHVALSAGSVYALLSELTGEVIEDAVAEVYEEAMRERRLAMALSRRLLLGAAAGACGRPLGEVPQALVAAYDEMVARRRSQDESLLHAHSLRVQKTWRNRHRDDDSDSGSGDTSGEDEDEAAALSALPLSEERETLPRGGLLRAAFTEHEFHWWGDAQIQALSLDTREVPEPSTLAFSSDGALLAAGTGAGGLAVWQTPGVGGKIPTLVRRLGINKGGGAPLLRLSWSFDGTELLGIDAAGVARVWSLTADATQLYGATALKAAEHWQAGAKGGSKASTARRDQGTVAFAVKVVSPPPAALGDGDDDETPRPEDPDNGASAIDPPEELAVSEHEPAGAEQVEVRAARDAAELALDGAEVADLLAKPLWSPALPLSGPGLAMHLQLAVAHRQLFLPELLHPAGGERGAAGAAAEVAPINLGLGGVTAARGAGRDLTALLPGECIFHPSFTLLGTQPSVLLALRGGLCVKLNRPGAERVVHGAPLALGRPLAGEAGEPVADPATGSGANAVSAARAQKGRGRGTAAAGSEPACPTACISRECFVGHSSPLLCIGFVHHRDTMVTVGADGTLLLWPYSWQQRTVSGAFRPARQLKLGLSVRQLVVAPETVSYPPLFPPAGMTVPPTPRPSEYRAFVRRYEATNITPLDLPPTPWRVLRLDTPEGATRYTYYLGKGDVEAIGEDGGEFVSITRDADGNLLRHTTAKYYWRQTRGQLVAAALSPSAGELATLVYLPMDDPPRQSSRRRSKASGRRESNVGPALGQEAGEGPQLRLQVLNLETLEWAKGSALLPAATLLRPRLAWGPMLDVPLSDYIYVLADNVVRIYSLGSLSVVRSIRPLGANVAPPLDSIDVSSDGRHLVVGCSSARRVFLYAIGMPTGGPHRACLLASRRGSARALALPCEQRVREVGWALATEGRERVHVERYMRRTVDEMVDAAIAAAQRGGRRSRARPSRRGSQRNLRASRRSRGSSSDTDGEPD